MSEYKLSLVGNGISVETTVNKSVALSIVGAVMSQTTENIGEQIAPLGLPSALADATTGNYSKTTTVEIAEKPLSLREFMNEKQPKLISEIITTIAQFLAQCEDKSEFTRDDVRDRFAPAGVQLPKNYSRDIQTTVSKGWIGEFPDKKGTYFVTRTGEAVVEKGFSR